VIERRLVAPVVEARAKVLVNRTTVPPCRPGRGNGLRVPFAMVSQTSQSGKQAPCGSHCRAMAGVKRITPIVGLFGVAGRMGAGGTRRHHTGEANVKTVIGQV
jgi:hypothetical protein